MNTFKKQKRNFWLIIAMLILTVLSLSLCSNTQAQTKTETNISIGLEDRNMAFGEEIFPWLNHTQTAEIDFKIEPIKNLIGFTSVKTYMQRAELLSFTPLQNEYRIGTAFKWKDFTISYEHMCSHSIDSDYYRESYNRFKLVYTIKTN